MSPTATSTAAHTTEVAAAVAGEGQEISLTGAKTDGQVAWALVLLLAGTGLVLLAGRRGRRS